MARSKVLGREPEDLLAGDTGALAVLRAASAPHGTVDTAHLLAAATGAFLLDLAPMSAAAALMQRAGIQVPADESVAVLNLPTADDAAVAAWVADLDGIPVTSSTFSSAPLIRRKLASIVVTTAELMKRSAAPAIIEALLRRAAARALDAAMFDNTAGDANRPAGLLYGLAPIAGMPGGDAVARRVDLLALTAAASVAGGEVVYVMSPTRAASLMLDGATLDVIPSAYLAADTVVAIAPAALAVLTGVAEIDICRDGVIHMDTVPLEIVTVGGVASAPTRSLYQTDAVATRLLLDCGWVMQSAGAIAWASGVTW